MFWLVHYNLSCNPEAGRLAAIIQGPDNDFDAAAFFQTFVPHAIEINARLVRAKLSAVFVAEFDVKVMQPKPRDPFSSN